MKQLARIVVLPLVLGESQEQGVFDSHESTRGKECNASLPGIGCRQLPDNAVCNMAARTKNHSSLVDCCIESQKVLTCMGMDCFIDVYGGKITNGTFPWILQCRQGGDGHVKTSSALPCNTSDCSFLRRNASAQAIAARDKLAREATEAMKNPIEALKNSLEHRPPSDSKASNWLDPRVVSAAEQKNNASKRRIVGVVAVLMVCSGLAMLTVCARRTNDGELLLQIFRERNFGIARMIHYSEDPSLQTSRVDPESGNVSMQSGQDDYQELPTPRATSTV